MKANNLAYASSVWTLRALWNLSHTRRRYDQDDTRPMNAEEWASAIGEARLSLLRLQALLDAELDKTTLDLFFRVENVYADIARIGKEVLYLDDQIDHLIKPIEQLDHIRKRWEKLLEVEGSPEQDYFYKKLDQAIDKWAHWLQEFSLFFR